MADSETQSRKKDLQKALAAKKAEAQEIADSLKIDGETVVVEKDQKSALDATIAEMKGIRELLESFSELDTAEKWINEPGDAPVGFGSDPNFGGSPLAGKSIGEAFLSSDEFKSLANGKAGANSRAFEMKVANMGGYWRAGQKDLYSQGPYQFPGGTVQRDRDLFPVQTTSAAVIEYFRVMGFINGASTVGQRNSGNTAFALKPQTTLQFAGEQSPVRTIAHWEAAHRNVLADEPQLRGIIDNELLYGLRLIEDAQIMYGTGAGDDLRGILNTPGIQNYLWSNGATLPVADTKVDAIRRAATLAFLALYQPTGVVVHPNDWEDMELTKSTTGQYLLAVSIALGGEQRVWRMPVIDTPAINEGTALVGAFGIGAQLYDREEANIRVAEQHSDFFIRKAHGSHLRRSSPAGWTRLQVRWLQPGQASRWSRSREQRLGR
jgi:hypothetical protein